MRILLIMDPGLPVPPTLYGGHERLVYMFAEEYIKLGHKVTVLAGPESYCSGKTIHFGKNGLPKSKLQSLKEIIWISFFLLLNHKKYDLVHNFGRLMYLLPILNKKVKKIMTYGRLVSTKNILRITKYRCKNLIFTGCSNYLVSTGNVAGNWKTVYNAIDFSKYQLNEHIEEDAPLIFFSRLDKIKGCHNAITFAKMTNRKLLIAGNISTLPNEKAYFELEIKPFVDNNKIIFLGALNDNQKNEYLGKSLALLMFIEWDEPFGMVMTEAMACGTPVLGFRRGSIPEVVEEGVTGYVVNNLEQAVEIFPKVKSLNRASCRNKAEKRFDSSIIAQQYLTL